MPTNVTFLLDAREIRELRRAAKKRGLAMATVARALTLNYFGVKARDRISVGPSAQGTRGWKAPRKRA
jgi:hypothetical protein